MQNVLMLISGRSKVQFCVHQVQALVVQILRAKFCVQKLHSLSLLFTSNDPAWKTCGLRRRVLFNILSNLLWSDILFIKICWSFALLFIRWLLLCILFCLSYQGGQQCSWCAYICLYCFFFPCNDYYKRDVQAVLCSGQCSWLFSTSIQMSPRNTL